MGPYAFKNPGKVESLRFKMDKNGGISHGFTRPPLGQRASTGVRFSVCFRAL